MVREKIRNRSVSNYGKDEHPLVFFYFLWMEIYFKLVVIFDIEMFFIIKSV